MTGFPYNRVGVGLRSNHYPYLENHTDLDIGWFEAISENYMDSLGRPREMLRHIREHYPLALHGVSLSIASAHGIDPTYLRNLKTLVDEIEPFVVSDHLCWTRGSAHNSHDLLPFPYNDETLQVVVENVQRSQEALNRNIALENISAYLHFTDDLFAETDFLREISKRTGCGLLLDVNNVYVNASNYGFDSYEYLDSFPVNAVVQLHIAGHVDAGGFLFDTHSRPVRPEVWDLLAHVYKRLVAVPVLLEWDEDIPSFEDLQSEALKAEQHLGITPAKFITAGQV